MSWKKFYKLPLELDPEPFCSYAWTKDGEMALQFNDLSREDVQNIINGINGTSDFKIPKLTLRDKVDFYKDGKEIFYVRGYGGLTGIGGRNFSRKKADKIQDEFVEYILNKLK